MAAVLVEMGFLTNENEAKRLNDIFNTAKPTNQSFSENVYREIVKNICNKENEINGMDSFSSLHGYLLAHFILNLLILL